MPSKKKNLFNKKRSIMKKKKKQPQARKRVNATLPAPTNQSITSVNMSRPSGRGGLFGKVVDIVREHGCELLTTLASMVVLSKLRSGKNDVDTGAVLYNEMISPANFGTRLKTQASLYEKYRVNSIRVSYAPSCPTSTPGAICMFIDYDPETDISTMSTQEKLRFAMSHESYVTSPVWSAQMCRGAQPPHVPDLYVDQLLSDDTRETALGRLYVMALTPIVGDSYGTFSVDYDVSFSKPISGMNARSITYVNTYFPNASFGSFYYQWMGDLSAVQVHGSHPTGVYLDTGGITSFNAANGGVLYLPGDSTFQLDVGVTTVGGAGVNPCAMVVQGTCAIDLGINVSGTVVSGGSAFGSASCFIKTGPDIVKIIPMVGQFNHATNHFSPTLLPPTRFIATISDSDYQVLNTMTTYNGEFCGFNGNNVSPPALEEEKSDYPMGSTILPTYANQSVSNTAANTPVPRDEYVMIRKASSVAVKQ